MVYIISGILLVIAAVILGLIFRKKIYDEVDGLEAWKMDIMNRNVSSELARVKALNLSGETQEKFESWKDRWDSILTKELPNIEEYLFDVEEAADRYKMSTAKKNLRIAEEVLRGIESDIEQMFSELEQLLNSEKSSREEVEELHPKLKALRKKILQNRYQYGKAEVRFEQAIDELELKLESYYQLTASGDYFEAKSLVEQFKDRLIILEEELEEFPVLYKSCKQIIPGQIDDLLVGIRGMKSDGYHIDHLGFEKELYKYQIQLEECVEQLEKGTTKDLLEFVNYLEERIKEMYLLLEKEAVAKSYIQKKLPSYRKLLENEENAFRETSMEIEDLQEMYYFEDTDVEARDQLEKQFRQLKDELAAIEASMDDKEITHSEIRETFENNYKKFELLQQHHKEFSSQILTMRRDELEAKDQISKIKKDLYATHRTLAKSNIPGVPVFIWELLEDAEQKNEVVYHKLGEQPLDMTGVQIALSEAQKAVQIMTEQTEMLLGQAELVELVIQYANKYRSKNEMLAAELSEAEGLFREYEYEAALERAANALEAIEPGALKRLEEFRKVPS